MEEYRIWGLGDKSKIFWGSWNLVDLEIRNSIILGIRDSGTGGLGNWGSGGLRD